MEDDCDSDNDDSYGDEDDENRASKGGRGSSGMMYHEMPHGSRTNYKGHWTKEEVRIFISI